MHASAQERIESTKILLVAGADLDAIDYKGKTALAYTKEQGHTETVTLLESFIEQRQLLNAIMPESASITHHELNF